MATGGLTRFMPTGATACGQALIRITGDGADTATIMGNMAGIIPEPFTGDTGKA